MVVVAIITALIAILLPSLGKSMRVARGAVCASNQKQFQTAFIGYGTSNRMKAFDYKGAELFITPLSPYAGDVDAIRYCPETKEPEPGKPGTSSEWWWYNTSEGGEFGAYGFNGFMYGTGATANSGGSGYFPGTPIGTNFPAAWGGGIFPQHASRMPVFFDCVWVDAWPHHDDLLPPDYHNGQQGANYPRQMQRAMIDRHDMAINIVFADSHAERVPLDMLYDQKWSNIFERQGKITLP